MKQNLAWKKNNRREIKKTIGRFIAILSITMLGVGFFAGLKVTKEAMLETADAYISGEKKQNAGGSNLFDYRLISSYGLYDEDVEYIKTVQGVRYAEGVDTVDFLGTVSSEEVEACYKAYTITDNINKLSLVSGRMPQSADECVADALRFDESEIGKSIRISEKNEKSTKDSFTYTEYKIVGLVNSSYYLNTERGTTSIGNGSILAFLYFMPSGIEMDYYTEIYVKLDTDAGIYSDDYNEKVDSMKGTLEAALDKCATRKYDEIYQEADDKLKQAEKDYNDGLDEYENKKAEVEGELSKAESELSAAETEINNKEKELSDGKKSLSAAKKDYDSGLKLYESKFSEYNESRENAYEKLDAAQQEIDGKKKELETQLLQLNQFLNAYKPIDENSEGESEPYSPEEIEAMIKEVEKGIEQVDLLQTELDSKRESTDNQFASVYEQLKISKATLDETSKKLEAAKKKISEGEKILSAAKKKYKDGLNEYYDKKEEAEKEFEDVEISLSEAKKKIEDGKTELADIAKPSTYLLDRTTNIGYASFENDSCIVEGISKVFPVFFFMVAALVCITTMTRMVDEQRTQIGTLKALGYSNTKIAIKYMSYSGSAAIIGCVIGFLGGSKLFPWAIWQVYGLLYNYFAPIKFVIDIKLAIFSLIVSLICSVGATWLACYTELLQMPAELMRPKAPKSGKKIWMEYIPFLWSHMRFLHKVSARNIFRFKKRMLMMLLGIGGCTALIVTGFGVSDSITNIAADQYDNIMKYDYSILFKDGKSEEEIKNFKADEKDSLKQCVFVGKETVDAIYDGGTEKLNIIATSDKEITDIMGLEYKGQAVSYPKDGEAILSSGLAEEAGLKPGDTLTLKISDTETRDVRISGIFQNYVYHYMFMTEETYSEIFGEKCEFKTALAVAKDKNKIYETSAVLSKREDITSLTVINDFKIRVKNMLSSLNYVVALVIACAVALAFVVLYNLSNINITERIREIATIKVLGFYPIETNSYVFRENIVLTIMGTIIGLPAGIFLHSFVMSNIKIDIVSFMVRISFKTYIFAIIITLIMAVFVDIILMKKIDRVNMTESLKSVE